MGDGIWRADYLGRWHWIERGTPACKSPHALAPASSAEPPPSDRCATCATFAPRLLARGRRGTSDRAASRRRRPRSARPTSAADESVKPLEIPTANIEVDLAEPYFEKIRALISDRPSRYVLKAVLFCGELPYSVDALSRLLPDPCYWYEQTDIPTNILVNTVVVGQRGVLSPSISHQLDLAARSGGAPPRFIPQEGFVDEILFGHDWWTDYPYLLNGALAYHQGLQLAHAAHLNGDAVFPWPGTEAEEADGTDSDDQIEEFQAETLLHALGYQITGKSRATRWAVLTETAIPRLGLQIVVETIAMHIRLRKAQRDGRWHYRHAIAEWEYDLSRLKTDYWSKLGYRFSWPSSEP